MVIETKCEKDATFSNLTINNNVSSSGAALVLKSGNVAFTLPTADGSNGQQLTTNGSGTLTWVAGGTGPTGPAGAQGPAGTIGADGATGAQGPAGSTGAQGPAGPAGAAGNDGSDGAVGATGPAAGVGTPTITSGPLAVTATGLDTAKIFAFTIPPTAADEISTGDAAVTIATSAGNITIDAQGNDTDIIFKGTDGVANITALTLDMSDEGNAIFGNDVKLLSDSAVISLGANSDVTLTHVHNEGLALKHTATEDKPIKLTLQTGGTSIVADEVLGSIDFQAPDEISEADSRFVAAGIEAVAEETFSSSSNATKLSFKTGASETATEKFAISSSGIIYSSNTSGAGSGFSDPDSLARAYVIKMGGEIITTIQIAINGLFCHSPTPNTGGIISDTGTPGNSYFYQIQNATNGLVKKIEFYCVEAPTNGSAKIGIARKATANTSGSDMVIPSDKIITAPDANTGSDIAKGQIFTYNNPESNIVNPEDLNNEYLYLYHSEDSTVEYSAGKFVVKIYGYSTF